MSNNIKTEGIVAERLTKEKLADNFNDIHPPLTNAQAAIEAERCYYCFDAPCTTACPTAIDIPSFINRIANKDLLSSAHKIFEENIFGGMCARVCPTENLCEEACVRMSNEEQPVKIGLLQRHATDHALAKNKQFFNRAKSSGKKVAIIGAGPAGIACAHRLAMFGHDSKIFEANKKAGGLNEFGIAAYKTINDFAAKEIEYILAIGGIEIDYEKKLGRDFSLSEITKEYDAVFLSTGLTGVRTLNIENEDLNGVFPAVDFIKQIRQAKDLSEVAVGRNVVVIGGGMTAVDAASQSLRLGAETATIVYRRGAENLPASDKEIKFVQNTGVLVRYWAKPIKLIGEENVKAIEFEYTALENDKLVGLGETFTINTDMVLTAVGQTLMEVDLTDENTPALKNGKILVDEQRQTSVNNIWAGGDCVYGGEDLTVSAVEDGKVAAFSINDYLN